MKLTSVRRSFASAASLQSDTSVPFHRRRPAVGRSRVPSRWSRVDFPTPEAPMMATLSPAFTVRLTPRRTRTTSGPIRYSRSSSCATSSGSLITEHVHRIHASGPPGWRKGGQEGDDQGRAHDHREVGAGELHRQVADLVDVPREPDDLLGVLHPDQEEPERAARYRAHQADQHARYQEYRPDAAGTRPHHLHDPNHP